MNNIYSTLQNLSPIEMGSLSATYESFIMASDLGLLFDMEETVCMKIAGKAVEVPIQQAASRCLVWVTKV